MNTYSCLTVSCQSPDTSIGMAEPLTVELDQLLPEAENGTTSHVTVLVGETTLLTCKAYSLGQRTVSAELICISQCIHLLYTLLYCNLIHV